MPNQNINTLQNGLYKRQRSLCGQIMLNNNISIQFKVKDKRIYTLNGQQGGCFYQAFTLHLNILSLFILHVRYYILKQHWISCLLQFVYLALHSRLSLVHRPTSNYHLNKLLQIRIMLNAIHWNTYTWTVIQIWTWFDMEIQFNCEKLALLQIFIFISINDLTKPDQMSLTEYIIWLSQFTIRERF